MSLGLKTDIASRIIGIRGIPYDILHAINLVLRLGFWCSNDRQVTDTQMLTIIQSHLITASFGKATPVEEDHDR